MGKKVCGQHGCQWDVVSQSKLTTETDPVGRNDNKVNVRIVRERRPATRFYALQSATVEHMSVGPQTEEQVYISTCKMRERG